MPLFLQHTIHLRHCIYVFYSEPRVASTYFVFVHEPSVFMLLPLVLLTLFSLVFGEVAQDAFLSSSFWQNTISEVNVKSYYPLQEFLLPLFKNMSLFFTLMGLIFSFCCVSLHNFWFCFAYTFILLYFR